LAFLATLFLFVNGANLLTHEKTINRIVDGVRQRQYIVVLNDKSPKFGDKETIVAWVANFGIKADDVHHYYAIANLFQGFSCWMNHDSVEQVLEQNIVKYVEEDEVVSLDFTREPLLQAVTKVPANPAWRARQDWGQLRINARQWNLDTTPGNLYRAAPPATYADPYAPAENWGWNSNKSYQLPSYGERAVIWVVDTGVYDKHDEFTDGIGGTRVDERVNFVAAPDNGLEDLNGHGTHCASTAAGNWKGVATKARIRSVRVLGAGGGGSWEGVIAGIDYISKNKVPGFANILSASLGGGGHLATDEAINACVTGGVIAVVAAGNSNNNCCGVGGIGGNSPARAEMVIAVVASSADDWVASFSSFGPCCKSIAPGVNVVGAWIPNFNANPPGTDTDLYNNISGTSMATPHVAGAIAVHASTDGAPHDPDGIKADLATDQTLGLIGGLTGTKATTPNVFLYSQWKLAQL